MKVKVGKGSSHKAEIIVKEWWKRQYHATIGSGEVLVSESSSGEAIMCSIFDERGKNVGSIQLRATLSVLSKADQLTRHELTSSALVFSHFYRLDVLDDKTLRKYISQSKKSNVIDRIPTLIEKNDGSDKEWETSGVPSYQGSIGVAHLSNHGKQSSSGNDSATERSCEQAGNCNHSRKEASSSSETEIDINYVHGSDFDWDNPIKFKSIPTTHNAFNKEGKRKRVFLNDWVNGAGE